MKKITLLIFMLLLSFVSGYGQFTEGFEGASFPPTGWTTIHTGPANSPTWGMVNSGTTGAVHSGTQAALINRPPVDVAGTVNTDWLISNQVSIPINGQLRFFAKQAASGDQGTIFQLRISTTSQTLETAYTVVKQWTELEMNTNYNTYEEKVFNIPAAYQGQQVYIAFVKLHTQVTGIQGERWFIDDVNLVTQCLDPTAATAAAQNITGNTANLTWVGTAASWDVELVQGTPTVGTGTITHTGTNNPFPVTGLTPSTTYTYFVRANCGATTGNWVGPFTFTTTQVPATLNYTEGFEGTPLWTIGNGTQLNKWFIGTATNNGGTHSLYISSSTDGALNIYNVASTSVVHAYRDIQMPTNIDEVNLSFDWKGVGEGFSGTFYDYFRVWLVPASFVPTPGTQITAANGTQIGAHFNNSTTFLSPNFIVPVSAYAGQVVRLVFEWRNDGSAGTQPPAAIDNISIVPVTCPAPANITIAGLTENAATLSWNPITSVTPSYEYYLATTNTAPTAATTPTGTVATASAPLSGLTPSTTYYFWVRTNCGANGGSLWTGPFTFSTTQVPAALNYTEGFEGAHQWMLSNGTQTNKWIVGSAVNNGGTKSLYISNNGTANAYTLTSTSVVHAYRDIQMPATVSQVSTVFDWRAVGEGFTGTFTDYFRVWVVPATFTPVAGTQITAANSGGQQIGVSLNNSANFTTASYVFPAAAYAGQVVRIIFEWRNDGGGGTQPPAAIDNVNISVVTCEAPTALATAGVTTTTANVNWTAPASGAASYDYYSATSNTAPNGTTVPTGNVAGTTLPLTGLNSATTYYVWVRSNCGATNGTSIWTGPVVFTTPQVPATLNYTDGFEGANPQWIMNNGTQVNKWIVGTAVNNGGTHSLYITDNGGTTNTYNLSSASTVQAYRDIQMPATVGEISVVFDWRTVGESTYDYLRVWLVPASFTPTPGTQITAAAGRVQLSQNLNASTSFVTQTYIAPASAYAGQLMRLVFEWKNDSSGGVQPPAAVDNINIGLVTCSSPSAITMAGLTENATNMSWTPPANGAASYDYYLQTVNTVPTATTVPTGNVVPATVALSGLTPSTAYYFWVRSNCGTDGTSLWTGPFSFTTPQIPAQMNFADDFEGTASWTLNNGTQTNKWIIGNAVNNGGENSLYITNDNGNSNAYTLSATTTAQAYRDIQMPAVIGEVSLSFDWRANGESIYDYLRVWLVPVTFVPTPGTQITAANSGGIQLGANFNASAAFTTQNYIIQAAPYAGQIVRLVFEWRNDGSGGTQPPAAVDNINLSALTCPSPVNLASTAETNSSTINLSWTPTGTETQWEVVVQVAGTGTPVSGVIVNGTPAYSYAANAGVFYEYYVRAICSDTESSFWSGPFAFSIYSPPGCAAVDIVGVGVDIVDSQIILCEGEAEQCVNLNASYFGIGATTSYEVSSIPYNPPFPFVGGTEMNSTIDDAWSPVINLPFDFCFFGESYTSAQVGSNGVISFNANYPANQAGSCPYSFNNQAIPATNFPIKNAIYGVYQDIDPSINNAFAHPSVNYQVLGNYPCRALVVNFSEVAQFGSACNSNAAVGAQTSQIVIYEISNIIEVYVKNRVACPSWQSGEGVIGIQNNAGTDAYTPDDRNTGPWTATDEAWRFNPNGDSNVNFQWLRDGVFFSNQQNIQVCLSEQTTMVAQANYTNCNGDEINRSSEVIIKVVNPEVSNQPTNLTTCTTEATATFDLSTNTAVILDGLNAADYTVAYFLTDAAAQTGNAVDAIADTTAFVGTANQTIYVRVTSNGAATGCFVVKTFQLIFTTPTPADQIQDVTVCDSYILPALSANNSYYTGPGATGTQLQPGDVVTTTQTIHVFAQTGTGADCVNESEFTVTIGAAIVADARASVVACGSYTLPALSPNNAYYTATQGGGTQLAAGTDITTTQEIFVYAVSGTCTDENTFTVTITPPAEIAIANDCVNNKLELTASPLNGSFDGSVVTYTWKTSQGAIVGTNSNVFNVTDYVVGTLGENYTLPLLFTVTITNGDCESTEGFTVESVFCRIPKGLSPNGDGDNDDFNLSGLGVKKLVIFNRYGREVYSFTGAYTNQWHGQSKNHDELPDGTYYYMIEKTNGTNETGWVYINK
ncbi:fibronectin type III domain-containing protein [Flavobacterium kingsejongi]|uniref:Fibronectin type-III domain-containing protein n=1 Tax=Flavobacterium kingsejongi TaxID=1678728 RepID=A0A2S1LLL2_9FLAO|nr:fibronectin type III domain-containing protein [Flavobacterium kingsejongi]AWG24466.1 hypothetical protein FK004_04060 [Flavobacterium kingsejongi]